jgi:hypothetical protein
VHDVRRVRVTLHLSVSQSILALNPSGTHDEVLAVLQTVAVLPVVGRPPVGRTGLSCDMSQSFSVLAMCVCVCALFYFISFLHASSLL